MKVGPPFERGCFLTTAARQAEPEWCKGGHVPALMRQCPVTHAVLLPALPCRFVKYEFAAQPGRKAPVTLTSSTLTVVLGGLTPSTTVSPAAKMTRADTSVLGRTGQRGTGRGGQVVFTRITVPADGQRSCRTEPFEPARD